MYTDIDTIKVAANGSRYSHLWFGRDNLQRWDTRVLPEVYDAGEQGAFFVSSDQPDPDLPRVYTVQHIDADGNIRPVDGQAPIAPGVEASRIAKRGHAKIQAANLATAARLTQQAGGQGEPGA